MVCSKFGIGSVFRLHLWPVVLGLEFCLKNKITKKESKAPFSLKKNVYTTNCKKERLNTFFILTTQMGLLSERTHGDFICRMFQCLCTNFVTSACCIEYIACILRVEGGQAAFHCALQLLWMKSCAFDAFLYCTYLYILTILPCYEHRFCYICLFRFPTKIGP